MRKRYVFEISHPKHFYQFKPLAEALMKGNDVLLLVRDKDVSFDVVSKSSLPFKKFGRHGKIIPEKVAYFPLNVLDILRILKQFRPDVIVSRSSPYSTTLGRILHARSVIMPDSEVVPLINYFVAPISHLIITPVTFALDYGPKHHRVNGLFEEGYLHPKRFSPEEAVRDAMGVETDEPFFILRFVAWNANHDVKNFGFSPKEKDQLVEALLPRGRVFVSGEGKLPNHLAGFRLPIHPNEIHSALYYASLYIGDSQTMATESALLGTPSIRYNSFVGPNDMSNFRLLEKTYKMVRNCRSFSDVMETASNLLSYDSKAQWREKRAMYFEKRGDINDHLVDILRKGLT